MDTAQFLAAAHDRMSGAGYQVLDRPNGVSLLGYRGQFRLRWMATKLNLFFAVATRSSVVGADLEDFSRYILAFAKERKGTLRGLQSGVAAISVLVGDEVDSAAAEYASRQLVRQFAAFAWPVAVDLGSGVRWSQQGNPKIGRVYNKWMKEQIDTVLPRL